MLWNPKTEVFYFVANLLHSCCTIKWNANKLTKIYLLFFLDSADTRDTREQEKKNSMIVNKSFVARSTKFLFFVWIWLVFVCLIINRIERRHKKGYSTKCHKSKTANIYQHIYSECYRKILHKNFFTRYKRLKYVL